MIARRTLNHSDVMAETIDDSLDHVPWTDFSNFAYKHRVRIIDWEDDVDAPGPMFQFKKLGTGQLRSLSQAYVDHVVRGMDTVYPKVVPWPDGELLRT